MRLRQLAISQAVIWFAPPEVHQSILDVRNKKPGDPVDSYDVVCWLLEQTCDGLESLQPLYYSQGVDFCQRTQAALDNPDFLHDKGQRDAYLGVLRQKERQTLEQLYKPMSKSKATSFVPSCSKVSSYITELKTLRRGFRDTGKAVHGSALQEVEQEREVCVYIFSFQSQG